MSNEELTTERVRDLYTWAFAWRAEDDEGETDLSVLRESNRAEFDRWLAAHDRQVEARALEEAASAIRHKQHPESVRQMLNRRAAECREEATR